jgi:hypothetical protein
LFVRRIFKLIEKVSNILFIPFAVLSISLFILNMNILNGIIAAIYIVLILFKLIKWITTFFPTLTGTVTDENNQPIPNALVKLIKREDSTTSEVTRTNKSGKFKLFSPKQKYQIEATKQGYFNPNITTLLTEVETNKTRKMKIQLVKIN